jgi:hypothetical protein
MTWQFFPIVQTSCLVPYDFFQKAILEGGAWWGHPPVFTPASSPPA